MHALRLSAVTLGVALAGGWAGAAAAQGAVSTSTTASVSGLSVEHFAIAMNPSGERSAVAFEGLVPGSRGRRTRLFARLGRGRRFGINQELDDVRSGPGIRAQGSISDVRVAVSPEGVAVAGWIVTTVAKRDGPVRRQVRVATAPAGKRFGRPLTVLAGSLNSTLYLAGLVVGDRGLTVLCLERGNRVEILVRRRVGARFAPRQRIGGDTPFEAPPTLALAPDGKILAAWTTQSDATAKGSVLRKRGLRFGPAQTLSPPGEPTAFARAVAGPGGAGVAWRHTASPSSPVRFARLRAADRTFAAPVTVADVRISGAPHVAIPRIGLVAAWRNYEVVSEPGDNDYFRNPRLTATASWLGAIGPRALTALPALALRPALAALADRALVAWQEVPPSETDPRIRVAAAVANGWQPTETVPPAAPTEQRPRPTTSVLGDERPGGGDLAIAAGRSTAVLAFVTFTSASDGELIGTLRVAGYRP
ncbi:MAG TPA: hypothetical protein VNA28_12420 [Solirubrobacteraceae bacterium]|nr:hypothetical protein [Solirubrobacteraceae bacterium]